MKIRNWANRMLWFVLGAMMAGLFIFASPSRTEPQWTVEQRFASVEQRVAELENWIRNREAAEKAAAIQAEKDRKIQEREDRIRNREPREPRERP